MSPPRGAKESTETEWVVLNADSTRWARENAGEAERKRAKYYADWLNKPASAAARARTRRRPLRA